MLVSNYLRMMHEQLKMINRFLECWSGYFRSIIFEKRPISLPMVKISTKTKI